MEILSTHLALYVGSPGDWWTGFPLQRARNAELWGFLVVSLNSLLNKQLSTNYAKIRKIDRAKNLFNSESRQDTSCKIWVIPSLHSQGSKFYNYLFSKWFSWKMFGLSISVARHFVIPVLQKMQNPGSPNGPPMVVGWVVRLSSG